MISRAISALRLVYAALACMFLWFASLQFNDIDAALWIVAYGVSSMLCLVSAFGIQHRFVGRILVGNSTCLAIWIAFLIPQVTGQFWEGEIERELGGLSISFLVSTGEYFLLRKMSRL